MTFEQLSAEVLFEYSTFSSFSSPERFDELVVLEPGTYVIFVEADSYSLGAYYDLDVTIWPPSAAPVPALSVSGALMLAAAIAGVVTTAARG